MARKESNQTKQQTITAEMFKRLPGYGVLRGYAYPTLERGCTLRLNTLCAGINQYLQCTYVEIILTETRLLR